MKIPILVVAAVLSLQAQPKPQRFTLPNGLRVVHLEDHQRPLVRACLHLELDDTDTPPGQAGLAPLFLRLFDRSTAGDMDASEIDALLEGSGIQATRTLSPRALEWRFLSRSRDQDRTLGLLADRLLRTILDPAILVTQRQACWRDEEQQQAHPELALRAALAPNQGLRPTPKSLGAIRLEDLLAFRARVFRPDRAILILHGDVGLEQAKRVVMLSLGSWVTQPMPPPVEAPKASAPVEGVLRLASQNPRTLAQVVAPRPSGLSAESEALLSILLEGSPSLGPANAIVDDHCLVATLVGGSDAPADEILNLLWKRLGDLRRGGFTQTDLDRARTAWLARLSLTALHPGTMIDTALAEALGRGLSVDRMKGLSLETVNEDLRRWLDPAISRSGVIGRSVPISKP